MSHASSEFREEGPKSESGPVQADGSRRSFLKRSAAVAATAPVALGAGEVLAQGFKRRGGGGIAPRTPTPPTVPQINPFNLLPNLYTNWNRNIFQQIQAHENAHVAFLVNALGSNSYPAPVLVNITSADVQAFGRLSNTFENTGVQAYAGAAPLINSPTVLAQAGSIASVESRHAGYLNVLFNQPVTQGNQSFEGPLGPHDIANLLTPFFADPGIPVMLASMISPFPSDANDIQILRFALGLEYLEAAFYNINVPRFASVL
jgi:hypothetical protein